MLLTTRPLFPVIMFVLLTKQMLAEWNEIIYKLEKSGGCFRFRPQSSPLVI